MKKLLFLLILTITQSFAQFSLQTLQVNYLTTPMGIDSPKPQFSWQMQGTKRGLSQKAYQIVLTNEQNQTVWDSKKINSDLAHAIQYTGEALKPATRYSWKLNVWDNFGKMASGNSWFETGLSISDLGFGIADLGKKGQENTIRNPKLDWWF